MDEVKKCCRCKLIKPKTSFCKNKSTKDGLQWECGTFKNKLFSNNREKLFPKIPCSCGKTVHKYYLEKHQQNNTHKLKLRSFDILSNVTLSYLLF
jgi:hypothetical protein